MLDLTTEQLLSLFEWNELKIPEVRLECFLFIFFYELGINIFGIETERQFRFISNFKEFNGIDFVSEMLNSETYMSIVLSLN